jgi:hypothetical protein
LNIEQILNLGQSSQSNQIIQNSEEDKMNFVMSYKTANDLIYGPTLKKKSTMNISEENPYNSEVPPISMREATTETVKLTPSAVSAGLPEKKKSLNLNHDVPLPKVSSPFDSKETRVEKVQAIL